MIASADLQSVRAIPTVGEFVENTYLPNRPSLRPASKVQVRCTGQMLYVWAGQEVFCDELSADMLHRYRAWRVEQRSVPVCPEHGMMLVRRSGTEYGCKVRRCYTRLDFAPTVKAATANKDIRNLRAIWHDAIEQGWNSNQYSRVRPLPEDLDNLPSWRPRDMALILSACAEEKEERLPCPAPAFWVALILTVYDTGARISAVMQTLPSDLCFESGTLTLRSGAAKGRKCQVIGLSDESLAALRVIYAADRERLFPWPHGHVNGTSNLSVLRNRFRGILARAKLPTRRTDLFHKLRRTTATEITMRLGRAAATDHLGHSHPRVTERYIDRTRLDETKRNARLLPRPGDTDASA